MIALAEEGSLPEGEALKRNIALRHRINRVWQILFQTSTVIGIIALTALLFNIVNQSFGFAAVQNKVDPGGLAVAGVPLEELPKEQLARILEGNVSRGLMRRLANDQPFAERSQENVY